VVWWDERMERMFGREPGRYEYSFDDFEDSIHEEDRAHFSKAITHALNENKPFDTVYRIKYKDGYYNYISARLWWRMTITGSPSGCREYASILRK
jgi:PAS domain-containing protein